MLQSACPPSLDTRALSFRTPGSRSLTANLAKQVWETTLGHLQLQVTRPSYQTWLKDTVGLASHDGQFVVGTPNTFVAEMLEQRMYSLISQAMERVTSGPVDVRFQVVQPADDSTSDAMAAARPLASPAAEALPTVLTNGQHEFPSRPVSFNSRFTFETFIVGSSNELAHAAASAVADSPGHIYNPLVIYSDVGLGKTHLLHAVGQRIQAKGLPLIYATAEEFTNEYIKAIREGKTEEFRNRYRGAGALLLDDIQSRLRGVPAPSGRARAPPQLRREVRPQTGPRAVLDKRRLWRRRGPLPVGPVGQDQLPHPGAQGR